MIYYIQLIQYFIRKKFSSLQGGIFYSIWSIASQLMPNIAFFFVSKIPKPLFCSRNPFLKKKIKSQEKCLNYKSVYKDNWKIGHKLKEILCIERHYIFLMQNKCNNGENIIMFSQKILQHNVMSNLSKFVLLLTHC